MKKSSIATVISFAIYSHSWAGSGTGKVVDVTLRTHDNILLAKVENHNSPPACIGWYHTFAKKYDGSASVSALYAMLLSAQVSRNTVLISGTGSCLPGTGAEEIQEMNIGFWGN